MPVAFITILVALIVPVNTLVIDFFIMISMFLAVLIVTLTMFINEPLDFSSFPSMILFTTLFRLVVNVTTTRSILSEAKAGNIIDTFAHFVIGGNYIVGVIVFVIITIINFVVVTNGAQRIGEVAARFTLDALPGKQISIDADLNAGIINEDQARARRKKLEREADYFGAMDGASRFVQRDALVSIILIFLNIGAGLVVGIWQQGMDFKEALALFTQLTIGDGLVAQIPAILISTATGFMVTKSKDEETMSESIIKQLTQVFQPLVISGGFVMILGIIPGMPWFILIPAGLGIIYLAWKMQIESGKEQTPEEIAAERTAMEQGEGLTAEQKQKETLAGLLQVDQLELEIGYGLIPLVDTEQHGDLLERITNIRKQIAMTLGFIMPPMRIRDNITIKPGEYNIKIKGSVVAKGDLVLDRYLAMNPLGDDKSIEGTPTREPAFGLEAYWIRPEERARAELAGFTVVDPATVLATHITEVIKNNAPDLLNRQAVTEMLDQVKEQYSSLVEDLIPGRMQVSELQKVLQTLLKEKVSVRNLPVILETLSDYVNVTKDYELLTEYVRLSLSRQICSELIDDENNLVVATLDPQIEVMISQNLQQSPSGTIPVLPPPYVRALVDNIGRMIQTMTNQGYLPVFLVSPRIRPYFRKLIERVYTGVSVLSYSEITNDVVLKTIGMVESPSGSS